MDFGITLHGRVSRGEILEYKMYFILCEWVQVYHDPIRSWSGWKVFIYKFLIRIRLIPMIRIWSGSDTAIRTGISQSESEDSYLAPMKVAGSDDLDRILIRNWPIPDHNNNHCQTLLKNWLGPGQNFIRIWSVTEWAFVPRALCKPIALLRSHIKVYRTSRGPRGNHVCAGLSGM